jgi:hypothetical protein
LDGGNALDGGGDFDHRVGAIDGFPKPVGFGEGGFGVARVLGRDFDRNEAVGPFGGVVQGAELIRRPLDVLDGQGVENLSDVLLRRQESADGFVVLGAGGDGFFKNRGVGGHAAQTVGDQAAQFPPRQHAPADVVQPEALSVLLEQFVQTIHAILPNACWAA